MNNILPLASISLCLLLGTTVVQSAVVDFEDLALSPESFYNGSDDAGGFTSGGIEFVNSHDSGFWSGFAYSNTTDTTTPGFVNQYSAFAGSGAEASANYAVGFVSSPPFGIAPRIVFPSPVNVTSSAFTNTTYAGLSMRDGDDFAKQFGGTSGDDPDFFLLTVIGLDSNDMETGRVDFYLADYRFSDNSMDYIVQDWANVDLTPLGAVSALEFALETTDVGQFGPNTPSYFVMDSIRFQPVPESVPTASIAIAVLICLSGFRYIRL